MRATLRIAPAALALAALLVAVMAIPVAAVDAGDYVMWRFLPSGPRGVGMIYADGSSTNLTAETVQLRPNASYRYIGSSAGCGDRHQPADVIWSRAFRANDKGAAYVDAPIVRDGPTSGLRSIRLFQGTGQVDCAASLRYEPGGDSRADTMATMSPNGTRLIVFLDLETGNDRLTVAGHGFLASHGYRLVGASVACPSQPGPSTTLFQKTGQTNSRGIMWRHDIGADIANEVPKSVQLFSPSGRVACVTPR